MRTSCTKNDQGSLLVTYMLMHLQIPREYTFDTYYFLFDWESHATAKSIVYDYDTDKKIIIIKE